MFWPGLEEIGDTEAKWCLMACGCGSGSDLAGIEIESVDACFNATGVEVLREEADATTKIEGRQFGLLQDLRCGLIHRIKAKLASRVVAMKTVGIPLRYAFAGL